MSFRICTASGIQSYLVLVCMHFEKVVGVTLALCTGCAQEEPHLSSKRTDTESCPQ